VRIEKVFPDNQGGVPASDERHIVERYGVELDIYIVDRSIKVGGTTFLLPMGSGKTQMRLVLHLEMNPPDPSPEKAVRDIIEQQLELLSKSLREIQAAAAGTSK